MVGPERTRLGGREEVGVGRDGKKFVVRSPVSRSRRGNSETCVHRKGTGLQEEGVLI